MKITSNLSFKNFTKKKNYNQINQYLKKILSEKNEIINSLKTSYKYSFSQKLVKNYNSINILRIIGMGGSILGTKAIHSFLKNKIKKKIFFIDDLVSKRSVDKNKILNVIISKSGNTLETISNANILIQKNQKNIFITENTNNYLRNLAKKLKATIIEHNNFIGGRYSVLSEVGMLPISLMGLNEKKFKKFNQLIKNRKFINSLLINVSNTFNLIKKNKVNSIILNYDEDSDDLFRWYQQLVAESLGKKGNGLFPIISSMPKDNHSLMQLYLDGNKNNFFTFFHVHSSNSNRIKNNVFGKFSYLKNKDISKIIYSQKLATEKVFLEKKIPFRSFDVKNRSEETIGELFTFFILETLLLGKLLKVNPYNQPAVELIKKKTFRYLKN